MTKPIRDIRPDFPAHLIFRTNNRIEFPLTQSEVWTRLVRRTSEAQLLYGLKVHCLVQMPNHVHLLATSDQAPLPHVMSRLIGGLAKEVNARTNRRGHLFEKRYCLKVVGDSRYYATVYRYIYRNPVRGGLVSRVEDHPHSTLWGLLGREHLPISITSPLIPIFACGAPGEALNHLDWLNEAQEPGEEILARANTYGKGPKGVGKILKILRKEILDLEGKKDIAVNKPDLLFTSRYSEMK